MTNISKYNLLPVWRIPNLLPLYRLSLWLILLTYLTGVILDYDDTNDYSDEAKDWKTVAAIGGIVISSLILFYSGLSIFEHKNNLPDTMHQGRISWLEWRPLSTNWWIPISLFSLLQFIIILIFSRFIDYDSKNVLTNSIFWTFLNWILLMILAFMGIKMEYLRMSRKTYWYHFFNTVVVITFLGFLSTTNISSSDLLEKMWIWAITLGFLLLFFIAVFIFEHPNNTRGGFWDITPVIIIFIWCGYAVSFVDIDSWKLIIFIIYILSIIGTVVDSIRTSIPILNRCWNNDRKGSEILNEV